MNHNNTVVIDHLHKLFLRTGENIAMATGRTAPVLMEAVQAEIQFRGRKPKFAYVLDHDGRRTTQKIMPKGNKLMLDGAKHKAFYYEIVF